MENREFIKSGIQKEKEFKVNKKELISESLCALCFGALAVLLGSKKMLFDTYPFAFALLAASTRQAPFILIGLIASAFEGAQISLSKIIGACTIVAIRMIARLYLDKKDMKKDTSSFGAWSIFATLFSEHTYLRIMSGALGVFLIGVWRIIEGGFRFYDLFASLFYLIFTPCATWLFSWYFNINEQRKKEKRAF